MAKILQAKKLVISTSGNEPLNSFRDPQGKLSGYFVETAQLMAADLGVAAEFQTPDFAGEFAGVIAGTFDVVSDAITATPRRSLSLFFTNPYYPSITVLVVPVGKKKPSYADYNNSNVKISASTGSTQAAYVSYWFPNAQADLVSGVSNVGLEVASGRAAAGVMDAGDAAAFIKGTPSLTYYDLAQPLGFEYGTFAIQYGDWEFKNWLDQWTRYWNGRGYFQATYNKYHASSVPAELTSALNIPNY